MSNQVEGLGLFLFIDDGMGNGEVDWFGVVDDELELVGF